MAEGTVHFLQGPTQQGTGQLKTNVQLSLHKEQEFLPGDAETSSWQLE